MKKFLLAGCLAFSFGLPACADLKIALIDTGKVFDAFHKTKDVATRIAAKEAGYNKELQSLQAEYDAARQEAQTLENSIKDPSVPVKLREGKDATLAEKVKDIEAIEHEMEVSRNADTQELKDELTRSHQEITEEIMRVITAYVVPQGYDLVLDKTPAAAAPSLFPYTSAQVTDLTEQIIARLNAAAPSH